jgi:hypothetical protein
VKPDKAADKAKERLLSFIRSPRTEKLRKNDEGKYNAAIDEAAKLVLEHGHAQDEGNWQQPDAESWLSAVNTYLGKYDS